MRMKQLSYFLTIAETKSITKAGRKLFISQQALSQAMTNLEKDLQTILFERTSHGIVLTPEGEYLEKMAKQILDLNSQIDLHFCKANSSNTQVNSINIAAISSYKDYILPATIVNLMKKYPNYNVSISIANNEQILNYVSTHTVDIGFLGTISINNVAQTTFTDDLLFVPFARFKYCVLFSENSPLSNFKTISIKSLLKYPIVFLKDQIHDDLEHYMPYCALASYGKPKIVIADSLKLFINMIEQNMAISIGTLADTIDFRYDDASISYRPLRDQIHGQLGYLLHKDHLNDEKITNFLEIFLGQIH